MHQAQLPIAIFISSFAIGGTERQMVELATRLDRSRFRPLIACFSGAGPLRERVDAAGIPVFEFPIAGGFFTRVTAREWRRFAAWCRAERIVVLQTSDFYTNVFALPGAALARVPVRIGGRRELKPERTRSRLLLQRTAYVGAHCVVANCRAAATQLASERVPASRVVIVPNGLEARRFSPRHVHRVCRVGMVANLRPEKGHDILLRAAASLAVRHPDVEFVIAGDGSERERIERQIRSLGLDRSVRMMGHATDVPALLATIDAFVLPSRSEAFPNAVLEAMAAGLPVVATAVGGLLELIEHERNGLLVPVNDADALAAALERVIDSPELAAGLGAAASQTVLERYSFDRMVNTFEMLYEAMTGWPRAAAAPLRAASF